MGSLEHFVYARMQFSHTYKSLFSLRHLFLLVLFLAALVTTVNTGVG